MLALDHRAHLLRGSVVRVVVAGRERVRTDHDPALRLVAEAGVARLHDHLAEVGAVVAQPVAHTVVAREVRRRLGRRDEVVAGDAVVDGPRERAFLHARAEGLGQLERLVHRRRDARLDPVHPVHLLGHADPQALEVFRRRELDRRHVDGRRVVLVAAGDDRVEVRAVANVPRDRTDLVERRREGDDAVARHRAVRRPQAHVTAERRRLLDRAAGVGPQRPRRKTRRDGGGAAAARAARNACRVPRVARRAVRRVLGRGAHRELVGVRLADHAQAARTAVRDHGRVVDRDVALEDLRAGSRRDPAGADDVLDRDRDARARVVLADVEERVQLGIALTDRIEVGVVELVGRHLAAGDQPVRLLCGKPERVDGHAGGVLK